MKQVFNLAALFKRRVQIEQSELISTKINFDLLFQQQEALFESSKPLLNIKEANFKNDLLTKISLLQSEYQHLLRIKENIKLSKGKVSVLNIIKSTKKLLLINAYIKNELYAEELLRREQEYTKYSNQLKKLYQQKGLIKSKIALIHYRINEIDTIIHKISAERAPLSSIISESDIINKVGAKEILKVNSREFALTLSKLNKQKESLRQLCYTKTANLLQFEAKIKIMLFKYRSECLKDVVDIVNLKIKDKYYVDLAKSYMEFEHKLETPEIVKKIKLIEDEALNSIQISNKRVLNELEVSCKKKKL